MDLEALLEMFRTAADAGAFDSEDDDISLMVVKLDDLFIPPELALEYLPEPNCDDPSCAACMMLRRLRGESLGGVRPSDGGPPIII